MHLITCFKWVFSIKVYVVSIHFITFKIDFFSYVQKFHFKVLSTSDLTLHCLNFADTALNYDQTINSNQAIKNVLFPDLNLKWNEDFELSIIFFIGDFENSSLQNSDLFWQKQLFCLNRVSTTTEAYIDGRWKWLLKWQYR